jgi:glucose-6-phosphate 1-dehydrogenase
MNAVAKNSIQSNPTIVAACAPDLGIQPDACLLEKRIEPCTIVILGATGDLTARKLLPALFSLFINDGLPDPFVIVGCGRTDLSNDAFREQMRAALIDTNMFEQSHWAEFAPLLYYRHIQYDDPSSFTRFAEALREIDHRHLTEGNRIFYFALPPFLYKPIAQHLGRAELSSEEVNGNGWSRIVVEKPFGHNLETAVDLDKSIHEYFREHQIFRIDHYLAKETVQNVLMFRFANSIFEPVWNRRYIDYVSITATETLGVEKRAGYYEQAGILRDMFQNHMMQLLALIAMEPPSLFEADRVRDEKVKVYRALRPFPVLDLQDHLALGQYRAGTIDGVRISGYREEEGVDPNSLIPTFAMMKVFLDNWRWQGVPFILTSGKRLAKKITEIAIQFKAVPHSMFRQILGETIAANRLTLGIYPEEKITMTFQTKNPGAQINLRTVTMDFDYQQNYTGPTLEAYEKVLIDCMLGDQMLFWRQDGVELCWSFLTPILEGCETCGDQEEHLHFYEVGSWGPEATKNILTGKIIRFD